jgi:hypothetical protein
MFGYHVTGSTRTLFLNGIVVGAIGVLGLSLLLAGARRTSGRGREARRGLKQSRRETATASQARDDLIDECETARAYTASSLGNGAPSGGHHPEPSGPRWNRLHLPRHRPEALHAAGTHSPSRDGQPASGTPAHPPVSADSTANVSQP